MTPPMLLDLRDVPPLARALILDEAAAMPLLRARQVAPWVYVVWEREEQAR
jgi:hypothetical protein